MIGIKDIESVANAVINDAKGAHEPINYGDFVSCATTVKSMGSNQILPSLSQVMSKTIFSVRPYTAKFKGLYKDSVKYGNHVRKITFLDTTLEKDGAYFNADGSILADGQSVDQYKISKPKVLETNFYDYSKYMKSFTIFKEQYDTAFQSPENLQSFMSGVMVNANDQLEQTRESLARGLVVNGILGTYENNQVVHLLTEYNDLTGQSLTKEDIMKSVNYKPFMQWVYARLQNVIDTMSERTTLYHVCPTVDKVKQNIVRHTPKEKLHAYFLSDFINKSANMMESNTFNADYLSKMDSEKVTYWQTPKFQYDIESGSSYCYMGSDGAITTKTLDKALTNVVGFLFDDEMLGINLYDQSAETTPLNAKGLYHNIYWHEGARWWVDSTENAIVICLD